MSTPKKAKATTPKAVEPKKVEENKVVPADKNVITPIPAEAGQVGPENDTAIEASKAVSTSEDSKTQDYADTKESKDKLKEHKEFVKDVEAGKVQVSADSPADLSTAVQPMVADPKSGEAKYVSADAWLKAESAKGNL